MKYELRVTKSFERVFRKLPKQVQQQIKSEIFILEDQPYLGESLRGELRFLRSFHLKLNNVHYRVVYKVDEKQRIIDLHYAGVRENFYTKVGHLRLKKAS